MEETKYFIGKNANTLYETLGKKRSKELESLAYNTANEIFDFFYVAKYSNKLDYIPILQYWQDKLKIKQIEQMLKVGTIDKIHFDFTGPLKKDVTNIFKLDSNTKVLCEGTDFKISVEGKCKDFKTASANQKHDYPTIKQMKVGRPAIIQSVINSWLDVVQDFCKPDMTKIDDLQYQFLLRLVDACNKNSGKAIVLYQLFYEKENTLAEKWIDNLRTWKSIINPNERLSFFVQKIQIAPIDASVSTEELLQKVKTDRAVAFEKDEIIEI